MIAAFVGFILSLAFGAMNVQKYMVPTKEDLGVYKNEIHELYDKPVFTVGPEDRLLIIFESRHYYKVQTTDNKSGWVEKQFLVPAVKVRAKPLVFEDAQVIGYLDNPVLLYIIDANNVNADPIKLDRSFKYELHQNTDMETIERQAK